jgi:hypothetical protein
MVNLVKEKYKIPRELFRERYGQSGTFNAADKFFREFILTFVMFGLALWITAGEGFASFVAFSK